MSPKVFIIVLNWNRHKDTIECIESLKRVTYPNYGVVIVDNGSTDGSEEILKKRFPEIPLIQAGENLGYAGGNNVGIRYALEKGGDYIILLNNDTIVDPEFVTELVKVATSGASAEILNAKIYFYDQPDVLWCCGTRFSLRSGWSRQIGYGERDNGQYDSIQEVDVPCGCAMMVPRSLCERVGLLNEEYFCYVEEAEWALRAKKEGFRVIYVPGAKVWHKVGASSDGMKSGAYIYYALRNTLRCLRDNAPYKSRPRSHVRAFIVILLYIGSLFTLGIQKQAGLRYIYLGVRDYYRNRFGRFLR